MTDETSAEEPVVPAHAAPEDVSEPVETNTEEPAVTEAPDLTKDEEAETAQNTSEDNPSVKSDSAKRAAELAAQDNQARIDNPNVPVARAADPSVGGESFHNFDGK